MRRLINYNFSFACPDFFGGTDCSNPIEHRCVTHLCGIPLLDKFYHRDTQRFTTEIHKGISTSGENISVHLRDTLHSSLWLTKTAVFIICALISLTQQSFSQQNIRKDILLNDNWSTTLSENKNWQDVSIPHNWDDYYGYRRLLHGNLHGDAVYKRTFTINQSKSGKRFFLFFEGAGSYATVFLNGKHIGSHAGGRTTFTLDATAVIKTG